MENIINLFAHLIDYKKDDEGGSFIQILDILSKSNKLDELKEKGNFDRLLQELLLIYKGRNAEVVLKTIQMCQYCSSMNEPYILLHNEGALYLFYLVDIIKMSPIKTEVIYQNLLGTYYDTKPYNCIYIEVRQAFCAQLERYCLETYSDYQAYYDVNSCNKPILHRYHFFKKNIDLSDKIESVDKYDLPVFKAQFDTTGEGIVVFVADHELLEEVKNMLDDNPNIDYQHRLKTVASHVTKDEEDDDGVESNYLRLLNSMISSISQSRSCYDNNSGDISPFYDRDSVFNAYVHYGEETAYKMMEEARKGRFAKSHYRDFVSEPKFAKLAHCRYLICRAHSAQLAYFYLLLGYSK